MVRLAPHHHLFIGCLFVLLTSATLLQGRDVRSSSVPLTRMVRQAPIIFPGGTTVGVRPTADRPLSQRFPPRIAGGINAFQPSVGVLSSNSIGVSDRVLSAPPIVFGPSLRRNPWFRRFSRFRGRR
ncbi:hypothetical protein Pmani_014101 [Petrolisthes manimaculis]|uniref:Secreted protein n=1 Tax=Petrolisthes manimaculis TaxID=1843537 RepID=A0AAE1U8P7_9EUCA|nr:hypothetical protein Pmani_014101 [Petrolisthes manimaculis]